MTTELEQEFFKVFGIKPMFRYLVQSELPVVGTDRCRPTYDLTKELFKNFALSRAKGYKLVEVVKIYPEITDRKLLKMICIVMKYKNTYRFINGIEDLKEQTLKILITLKDMLSIYAEIQQLFKEGE